MMDDTDLTDHHGEAEALRKENARLRAERDRWRNDCLDANNSEFQLRRRAEAAEADLATLRAQPDWKAMAERLGEALGLLAIATGTQDAGGKVRAALSDLAKMKGDNK